MSEPSVEQTQQSVQQPAAASGGEGDGGGDLQVQQMLADAIAAGNFLNRPQSQPQAQAQPQSQPQAPSQPEEPGDGDAEDGKDWKAEAEKWRNLARKHERKHLAALGFQSKEELDALRERAQKYAEIEEAQKSEIQKATERAQEYERQLREVRVANARLIAAATYNIPPELIDHLAGSTEDEINASAEALARFLEEQQKKAAPASQQRPVEALKPGAAPASATPPSPDAWIRAMAGRKSS